MRSRAAFAEMLRVCLVALMANVWVSGSATAQIFADETMRGAESTGVTQKLGSELPLDLALTDSDGQATTLGAYFKEGRPVVLTFNYSDCPQLCILQLDGLVKTLNGVDFELGKDIQIVTISLDPSEQPERAKQTQELYLRRYEGAAQEGGWAFLVADSEVTVRKASEAAGYGYDLIPSTGEFSHEAALVLCSPDGVVRRYLFGIEYEPKTFRYSMIDVSEGKLGTIVDRIPLFCFQYDPESDSYVLVAVQVMKLGGLLTMLLLGGFLTLFWRQEILSSFGVRKHGSDDTAHPEHSAAGTPSATEESR